MWKVTPIGHKKVKVNEAIQDLEAFIQCLRDVDKAITTNPGRREIP